MMKIVECGLDHFLEECKKRNVICFGAGNYFEAMCYDIGSAIQIIAAIDSNSQKWGKAISAGSVTVNIFSPSDIGEIPGAENAVLLVTASAYTAITDKLSNDPNFDDILCYVYPLMKFKSLIPLASIVKSAAVPLIPKVLHYGWFGGNPIPGHLLKIMETWKKYCPEYEIVRWDESTYDVKKNAYVKKAYEQKEWTFVNDYARIDIICQYGGIFLDTDVEVLKNLDDLCYNAGFIGAEPICGINAGSGFGAIKEFPAFCELLKAFDIEFSQSDNIELKSNLGRETAFFCDKGFVPNGEYQIVADTAIFPFNVLSPKIRELGTTVITGASFCNHHFNGSWIKSF